MSFSVAASSSAITLDIPTGDEIRVLVVDDSEDDVALIRELLSSAGADEWVVESRSTLEAGIEALHNEPIHVCLVDLNLGPNTGLDLIRSVAREATAVPIIVLTGQDSRKIDLAAMEAGATYFLTKYNLNAEDLERTIRYSVEQARSRSDLIRLARRDPLTGLHNRASIEERIAHAQARADRFKSMMGVLLIDLDGFKAVNDSLGHACGDQLLKKAAERLLKGVRPYDSVGRLGGDEFIIVLEDLDSQALGLEIANRLVRSIAAPYELDGEPRVSASIGLAVYPGYAKSAEELINLADAAMYSAKRQGKGRTCVFRQLEVERSRTPGISQVGREALTMAALGERLRCDFEPQMDLRDRTISGAEIIVWWEGASNAYAKALAELGGALEETELDLWLLSQAQEAIRNDLKNLTATVKLSPQAILSPQLVERVGSMLATVDRGRIELEVMDAGISQQDIPRVSYVLTRLRTLGLRIRLGGFGMGKSLLRHSLLPLDSVCLHSSFVEHIANPSIAATVKGLTGIAERANLSVVGVGVEEESQIIRLRELGVNRVQGEQNALGYKNPYSKDHLS